MHETTTATSNRWIYEISPNRSHLIFAYVCTYLPTNVETDRQTQTDGQTDRQLRVAGEGRDDLVFGFFAGGEDKEDEGWCQ